MTWLAYKFEWAWRARRPALERPRRARGWRAAAILAGTVMALGSFVTACTDPVLREECPNRICNGLGAEQGIGGADGEGGDSAASSAASGGGQASSSSAASSSSGGAFEPEPCACPVCMSHAACQDDCPRPEGINACYFPAEGGCWLVDMPCPQG